VLTEELSDGSSRLLRDVACGKPVFAIGVAPRKILRNRLTDQGFGYDLAVDRVRNTFGTRFASFGLDPSTPRNLTPGESR
jgi:hypothetical protein